MNQLPETLDALREDWRRECAAIAAGMPYEPQVALPRPPQPARYITWMDRRRQMAVAMQAGASMAQAAQQCGISHFALMGQVRRAGGKAAFLEKYGKGSAA